MNEKDFKTVVAYVKPLVTKWIKLTGAGWDRVDLVWRRERFSESADGFPDTCMGSCRADWKYAHAAITFSVPCIAEHFDLGAGRPKDPEYIRELVIHEIMHILVNEMREWRNDSAGCSAISHEERTVTRLARAAGYIWDEAFEAGKKAAQRPRKKRGGR